MTQVLQKPIRINLVNEDQDREEFQKEYLMTYELGNILEKDVISLLEDESMKDSLFYLDFNGEYKTLTVDYLKNNRSVTKTSRNYVFGIYTPNLQKLQSILKKIPNRKKANQKTLKDKSPM